MTVQDTAQQTPADRFRVGIDIGGTKIEAVLVDPQDNVRNVVRIPARRGNAQVIDDVVSITHEVAGDLFDQVATVGIGIPGQVNPETGRVDNVVNLDIDTLELGAEAGKRLGIPVHVENDVNAAAVGAARMVGGSHPEGTIVFLNFGTGLAAGIVVDGVVQHGFSGAAGEIGHIPIDPNRFPCPCGRAAVLRPCAPERRSAVTGRSKASLRCRISSSAPVAASLTPSAYSSWSPMPSSTPCRSSHNPMTRA